ncbi:FtsW/RodA/SpoVE family cell cycle protein [Halalkalibacter sp. APA_J-10(15)]|uniref:FtsW/RodA/SpoVE family cell cycle protein n=2 Tax=unclassified Halalkalibacter TaxID=2893063 RepID=UPI001FF12D18|nr:FtsW/RodA/SpoVE family cell cycle protein [Halalkalibacter sp. APA_J-10(15)]MCK0471116.1 FtsW/RodA/SpoVE family cell cycle protein [Halalkalibacter sp. APA_J-10(15)]
MSRQVFKQFINEVKAQIRSKEAQQFVEAELTSHFIERKQEMLTEGLSEIESEKKAVEQLGNPLTLGKKMHQIHKPKIDWWTIGLLLAVISIGMVTLYSLPTFSGISSLHYVRVQLISSIIALVVMTGIMFLDYRKMERYWMYLLVVGIILSFFFFYLSSSRNGILYLDMRYFDITFWSISLLYILALAGILSSKHLKGFMKVLLATVVIWLLVALTYLSLGSAMMIFLATCLIMSAVAPMKRKRIFYIVNSVLLLIGSTVFALFLAEHQMERIVGFLYPEDYASSYGYIYVVIKELLREATFLWNDYTFIGEKLPEAHTDFIIVSIIHQFGWGVGSLIFITLFAFLIRILQIVKKTNDPFGRIIALASMAVIGVTSVWNMGMVFGLLPIIGISLPFTSYGGASMILYSIYVGFILSVYRRKDLVQHQTSRAV